jgi:hypothetical protein
VLRLSPNDLSKKVVMWQLWQDEHDHEAPDQQVTARVGLGEAAHRRRATAIRASVLMPLPHELMGTSAAMDVLRVLAAYSRTPAAPSRMKFQAKYFA